MIETELRQQLIDLAPWHFDMAVGHGLRTVDGNVARNEEQDGKVGVVSPEEMAPLLEKVYPQGLAGRSFLDVGCNSGGYCFLARRLGAGRVLGFDVREHWIRQANFLKDRYGLSSDSSMQFRICHMEDLDVEEMFDVSLFKGVFYHVPDPIHELRRLCDRTRELVIIDTITQSSTPENGLLVRWESASGLMSGVDELAWAPGGPRAVAAILRWRGFTEVRTVFWKKSVPPVERRRGRMRLIAAREEAVLSDYEASSRP